MQRLNLLIGHSPELKTLNARSGEILALQKVWEAIAPHPLNQHSHIGPLRQGRMTVYAGSSAVATKLKMQMPRLLEKLQSQGVKVTSIRVEVQVLSKPLTRARVDRRLSQSSKNSLRKFSDELPDSPLRRAITQLVDKSH